MATANSLPLHPLPAAAQPSVATPGNPEFLTNDEAAAFLRLSPRTLEKQRVLGGGPRFRKFGARVLYAAEDLRAWANSRAYDMTSDPGCPQRASVR
ncbi:helix-turn-helix domain-containing protein [Ramlibacter sp. 2FC]|uniref:helix-turn-helix transcriptional regulator n=1 Tax=Ramlibacter sp. 2FC TaxID=2502188 RepID=UPI0010F9AFAC|nr:helix-turn-helix domain-containing protein [Ramlibacter sp. 2FC]